MVGVQAQAVVAVLTRAPSAGGKTRLFDALGMPFDPALLAALLLDTLDGVALPGVARAVLFTPPGAAEEIRALVPPEVRLLAQREGDLGTRMRGAFDDLLAAGAHAVVLVGSDLPMIDASAIARALTTLRERPGTVVIGPADDGGYYLVGATTTPAALFAEVPWGTADVLRATMAAAARARLPIVLLEPMADVDTPDDLRVVREAAGPGGARTRAWSASRVHG